MRITLFRRALTFLGVCPPEVGCYKTRRTDGVWRCIRCES